MVLLLRIRGVAGFDTIPRGLFKGLTIEAVRMTSPVYHSEVRLEADRWKMKMWPASFSTNSVVDASSPCSSLTKSKPNPPLLLTYHVVIVASFCLSSW